jgi:hypothetical protein
MPIPFAGARGQAASAISLAFLRWWLAARPPPRAPIGDLFQLDDVCRGIAAALDQGTKLACQVPHGIRHGVCALIAQHHMRLVGRFARAKGVYAFSNIRREIRQRPIERVRNDQDEVSHKPPSDASWESDRFIGRRLLKWSA